VGNVVKRKNSLTKPPMTAPHVLSADSHPVESLLRLKVFARSNSVCFSAEFARSDVHKTATTFEKPITAPPSSIDNFFIFSERPFDGKPVG
jgi:hypothetical protein